MALLSDQITQSGLLFLSRFPGIKNGVIPTMSIRVPRPRVGALPSCQEPREAPGRCRRALRSPCLLGSRVIPLRRSAPQRQRPTWQAAPDLRPATAFGFVVAAPPRRERRRDVSVGCCLIIVKVRESKKEMGNGLVVARPVRPGH